MTGGTTTDLPDAVLAAEPPAFALLHRPGRGDGGGGIDVLVGDVATVDRLADIPLRAWRPGGPTGPEALALVPYRQIAERGFACVDDGTPLAVLTVAAHEVHPTADLLARIPRASIAVTGGHFDVDDRAYADLVRRVVAEEIGRGEGSNFVLKRSYRATIADYAPRHALALFRRLVERESGAYWTFLVHTGERTLVGASPERHLSLDDGTLVMNPISGTYRYPPAGPDLDEVIAFLADRKEVGELYMVVDEELKMMARVCSGGGRVSGPFLKEMARLAHTEYFIHGRTTRDVRELLRETSFAPTVVGSPLESACRVVGRYEPDGRGYYSGVLALIGRDERGGPSLDSSILIRTADIDPRGRLRLGVGATIVRDSDPLLEVAETRAKAAGMLAALTADRDDRLAGHPAVRRALSRRNEAIAAFWLGAGAEDGRSDVDPVLAGLRVLVVDAEDNFTSMIDHQLRSLGMAVTVCRFDEPYLVEDHDLVVMGPGPGDPRRDDDPKIAHLRATIRRLLTQRRPFLGVCLSHQVLSRLLGLPLVRRDVPNQGVQAAIDLFGRPVLAGFYNTFAATCDGDAVRVEGVDGGALVVEVSRDPDTGEVHALRGPGFRSLQFHAESILTRDGVHILRDTLRELVARPRAYARERR